MSRCDCLNHIPPHSRITSHEFSHLFPKAKQSDWVIKQVGFTTKLYRPDAFDCKVYHLAQNPYPSITTKIVISTEPQKVDLLNRIHTTYCTNNVISTLSDIEHLYQAEAIMDRLFHQVVVSLNDLWNYT